MILFTDDYFLVSLRYFELVYRNLDDANCAYFFNVIEAVEYCLKIMTWTGITFLGKIYLDFYKKV